MPSYPPQPKYNDTTATTTTTTTSSSCSSSIVDINLDDLKLDPDAVRLRASSIPGCIEIKPLSLQQQQQQSTTNAITSSSTTATTIPTTTTTTAMTNNHIVCSFLVGCGNDDDEDDDDDETKPSSASNHATTATTAATTTMTKNHTTTISTNINQHQHHHHHHDDDDHLRIHYLARITVFCQTGTIMTSRLLQVPVPVVRSTTTTTGSSIGSNPSSSSTGSSSHYLLPPTVVPTNTTLPVTNHHHHHNNNNTATIRHLFRKNVTSLDIVERCLRYPAELPIIDWNLMATTTTTSRCGYDKNHPNDNNMVHNSIPNNLELLQVGSAILQSERDKLLQHVHGLEQTHHKIRQQQQQEQQLTMVLHNNDNDDNNKKNDVAANHITKALTTTTSTTRTTAVIPSVASTTTTTTGMEFQFSLSAQPMKHVDQCLTDIHQMGKLVKWVATNGMGTVFLYGHGGVAYTPNIPPVLYQRLSQLRCSKLHSSRPKYVSLGTKDRYFVAFHDNTVQYHKGCTKVLDRALKQMILPPVSVAFGTTNDTFCIVYSDGTFKYHGRGIPHAFIERLSTTTTTTSATTNPGSIRILLSSVTLGPSGEWFVRFHDGRVEYGNISTEMNHAIHDLLSDGHTINFLDFGDNGSYFVSYD